MIGRVVLIGCVLAAAPLVGCDVRTSRGAAGANASPAAAGPAAGSGLAFAEVRQRAVNVKLRAELQAARSACNIYEAENGRLPDFAAQGWSELSRGGYLQRVPTNPLSPVAVATKIIVTDHPGVTGADVDPGRAGWIFNTSSGWGGTMYAAGLRD